MFDASSTACSAAVELDNLHLKRYREREALDATAASLRENSQGPWDDTWIFAVFYALKATDEAYSRFTKVPEVVEEMARMAGRIETLTPSSPDEEVVFLRKFCLELSKGLAVYGDDRGRRYLAAS